MQISQDTPPCNVVIVEDDPVFVGVLEDAVRHLGASWTPHSFRNGKDIVEYIAGAECNIELALVDLGLPDIDGTDVIRSIRSHCPDCPILVVSVIAEEARVVQAIRCGASGYILKDDHSLSISRALEQVREGIYPITPSLARHLFNLAKGKDPQRQINGLSEKEIEVLQNLSRGHSYAEVAHAMGISLSTVQSHIRNLYRKLGANSGVQAISKARESGFI